MVSAIKVYKGKLALWSSHFQNNSLTQFPQMSKIFLENHLDSRRKLIILNNELNERFNQFDDLESILFFLKIL